MKKLTALLLAFSCIFIFASCADNSKAKEKMTPEQIYASIKAGNIPEADFGLSAGLIEVSAKYKEDSLLDEVRMETDSQNHSTITIGTFNYVFEADNTNIGVQSIYTFDTAYDFVVGSSSTADDVIAKMDKATGKKEASKTTIPTAYDVFFVPGGLPEGSSMVSYTVEDNIVKFFFTNNELYAVLLTK